VTAPLLEISGVVARYGEITALDEVSLAVNPGEAVALLGANGAGKSTLMKTIMGFLRPTAGTIRLAGHDLAASPVSARAALGIGYCPEGRRVFPGLTARENLEVAAPSGTDVAARIDAIYRLFPALREKESARGWQLSGGQQQMLAIGRALMIEPRLLLLDEPSLGLSPLLVNEVLNRVRDIVAAGAAVLLAEQNVAKALAIADRAYVLQVGKVVESGPAAELRASARIKAAFLGGS
jgi:branched-chain amino acid transport system ATP-binding protein